MQSARVGTSSDCCLRIVFDREVLSFGLAAGATFGDVARALRSVPRKTYGNPLAIDVTVAQRAVSRGLASLRR